MADQQDWFTEVKAKSQQPSTIGRIGRAALQASPIGAAASLYNDPIGTVVGIVKSVSGSSARERAIEQGRKGNIGAALREGAASMMGPGVSMIADQVASADADRSGTIESGELPELIGAGLGAGATAMIPKVPAAARTSARAAKAAPSAAMQMVLDRIPGTKALNRMGTLADKIGTMIEDRMAPPAQAPPPAPMPPNATTPPPSPVPTATVPPPRPQASPASESAPSQAKATVAAEAGNPLPPELAPTLESLPPKARAAAQALYEELQKSEQPAPQPKIVQKADFETAARNVKADGWAEVLHANGISSADVGLMTPEMWTQTAQGLGFRLPSKTTRAQIMREISRREKMMRVQ